MLDASGRRQTARSSRSPQERRVAVTGDPSQAREQAHASDPARVKWTELCASPTCRPQHAADVWTELTAAYAEPQRHYHTMDHIQALLALRVAHAERFQDRGTVDLAIFLHDVIYDPKCSDNEARSADWARARLALLDCDGARIERIAHLVEMSRHDAAELATVDPASDLALFLDLDLSILAADAPTYAAYARAIRQEYAIYPDLLYRPGRAKVLQGFLRRRVIYCAGHFRALWEDAARRNIEDELRGLTAPP